MNTQVEDVIATTATVPINLSCFHVQLDGSDSALFTNQNGKIVQAQRTEVVFMLENKYCFVVLHFEHQLSYRPASLYLTFPTTMNSCDSLKFNLEPPNPGEEANPYSLRMIPADNKVRRVLLEQASVALSHLFD